MRPKPSDYGIEMSNPEIAQALVDLVEMGLVVDSGQRRSRAGKTNPAARERPEDAKTGKLTPSEIDTPL